MNSPEIELVAFDLGNVLCIIDEMPPVQKLAKMSGRTSTDVHDIVFGKQHLLRLESGGTSFEEHARRAIAELGIDLSISGFTDFYRSALIPSDEMYPLVSHIAATHRIALVSNTSEPQWDYARRFLPFSAQLDPVIVSYSVGSMKPEPEFYDALLEQSGVPANQILFVDDLPANIEAAQKAGMVGHQFESRSVLEARLSDLGVI
ncbi:MAG: HAD family phosphatase [Chloroflexi bacterium]|nr:HAD family phosphatase [Chloroflexota bacterium]